LLSDSRVTGALAPEFPEEFEANLQRRGAHAYALGPGAK
jgi:hypothetical protein